jgi:hypothetical protein
MKDTQVEAMVAPARITSKRAGGWRFAKLASPQRVSCWFRRYCPRPVHGTKTNGEDSKHNKHYV